MVQGAEEYCPKGMDGFMNNQMGVAMTVSIIVPIYHGKKYIPDLLIQAERNAKNSLCELELLLVNDDPKAPLTELWNSDSVQIRVVNTDRNRGIHGARVRGLAYASGEYVLFLDQDDRIAPDYIRKQLSLIDGAAAVVCAASENQKNYYHKGRMLKECIGKACMTQKGNFIISPGQVLLRKAEIPEFWKSNILNHNGADDWFLWLCMLCAGKAFAYNEEILFEHCVHGENTSADGYSMLNSMGEVYEKMKANRDCIQTDIDGIQRVIKEQEIRYLRERDKLLGLYTLLDDWMGLWERHISAADYIQRQGYKKVFIYGRGRIGLRFAGELQAHQIAVCGFIDRDAEAFREGRTEELPVILPEKAGEISEPIYITLAKSEAEEVKKQLKEKGAKHVYLLSDVIQSLREEGDSLCSGCFEQAERRPYNG